MLCSFKISISPVAKGDITTIEYIYETLANLKLNIKSHYRGSNKQIILIGLIRLEKISQIHLKHWAITSALKEHEITSEWRTKGILIEHNDSIKARD